MHQTKKGNQWYFGMKAHIGDAGYQGQTEAIHEAAPDAQDMTSRRVKTKAGVDEAEKRRNRTNARVRAKVEWPFRILKRVFGFTRVRYRGLKKNQEWLCAGLSSGPVRIRLTTAMR